MLTLFLTNTHDIIFFLINFMSTRHIKRIDQLDRDAL